MAEINENTESKKTIWIINHYALTPAQGGLCRHFYFAKELAERGYNVRIFTSSAIHNTEINMISEKEGLFKEVPYEGVKYTYIKSSQYKGNGIGRIKNMLGFAFDIKKIWERYSYENPQVIYTSSPDLFTAWKAEAFAKKHKIPCVVEIRDLWPLSIVEYKNISAKNPAIIALFMLEKHIYKNADSLGFTMTGGKDYICVKKWEKKVNPDKIFNVNNGLDIDLQDKQRKEDVYNDGELDDKKVFKVVYAGSVREANHVGLLVEAAKYIKNKGYSDIEFLIFGDGTEKKILEKKCIEEKIDNVFFKGRIDKKFMPSVCAKSDLNMISVQQTGVSKYGVSWNKLFDYMNAGKPIVSTTEVAYDLIKKYECGIVCENQNIETIANAIIKIYNMPDYDYSVICRNAKNGAKDFDYKVLTDKLEEAIDYALKSKERK